MGSVLLEKHLQLICTSTQLKPKQVRAVLQLLEEGATIPFIARYRKEATGSLDEVQIAEVQRESKKWNDLEARKETILKSIQEQGKLTPTLEQRIQQNYDPTSLEDLYLPYKRKRKTRADKAREKGLEPLAQKVFSQSSGTDPFLEAGSFINEDVSDAEAALQGARDIIAEWINEDEQNRNTVRRQFRRGATIRSKVARGKQDEGAKYRDYFDFEEPLKNCPSHRLLAIRRGEEEGILRVVIQPEEEETIYQVEKKVISSNHPASKQVRIALEDAYKRLLSPSIETEFRGSSKARADEEAISVFAENLRQLLLAPPLGQKRTLGIDPGFRTGCKVVVLDASGQLLDHTTIFPHPPQKEERNAKKTIEHLVAQYQLEAIAIGNGTAGRETMALCRSISFPMPIDLFLVNESGASIYSASEVAREEFPDKDVTVRGAVSIGRRLLDPLAELVKIDPKSIGVGQYQHDVNASQLKESLDQVVVSCVNRVGININTASTHLLTYVSGLGPSLAKNIVTYRQENGPFKARKELLKVSRMGAKAYEQAAGFLRIPQAQNPLDNTGVHPESYHIVAQMAKDLGCTVQELIDHAPLRKKINPRQYISEHIGLPTLKDILKELEKPGLDPRGRAKTFEFANIQSINDLKPGMIVPGIINNLTNFGAFVDIGIKESGLVHVSQIANRFVKNPADEVRLQQQVMVKVMDIDLQRRRIQLSIKAVNDS